MKPIEMFLKQWNSIKDTNSKTYHIDENFSLQNGEKADIVIHLKDDCIALGKYFDELKLPKEDEIRFYFHGNNSFIGCGSHSKFWFYFDKKKIIINDHNFIYPYDELMKDYEMFFERLKEDN